MEIAQIIDRCNLQEYYSEHNLPVPEWKLKKDPQWWIDYLKELEHGPKKLMKVGINRIRKNGRGYVSPYDESKELKYGVTGGTMQKLKKRMKRVMSVELPLLWKALFK